MIEDLQDEYSYFSQKKQTVPAKRSAMLLVLFIFFIIYAGIIILITRPKINKALKKTNAVEIVRNLEEYRNKAKNVEMTLYFVSVNPDGSSSVVPFTTRVEMTGASSYHDAIEGLISGPSADNIKNGAINFIPKDTRLIGVTVSSNIAFVNLSGDFNGSGEIWGEDGKELAKMQIFKTLKNLNPYITEVVLLLDGIELA